MLCFFNIIPNADETCYMILHKITYKFHFFFSVLRRCCRCCWVRLAPYYGHSFLLVVDVPDINFQQMHVGRQFSARSSSACLLLLITSPIASTPRFLLSSVLGCLSFRETLHVHRIIFIPILSIFDSNMAHFSHLHNKQLLMHAM